MDLNVTELSDWRNETRVEYATRRINGHSLRLMSTLQGTFEIILDGEVVSRQIQPFMATEVFNQHLSEISNIKEGV